MAKRAFNPESPIQRQFRKWERILNEFSDHCVAYCTCGFPISFLEDYIDEEYGIKLWTNNCDCAEDDTIPA